MNDATLRHRSAAAEHLKATALRLFAERGVDSVTVRQIAEAAGQKNHAVVGYYFGSKEALVRELILDGARTIDERRNAWLDRIEPDGGPHSVLEAVEILVRTSIDLAPPGSDECYSRFFNMLGLSHRMLFMETLDGRWNRGYQRCLDHMRRLMPDMPPALKNQRFVFFGSSLGGILATREAELADLSRPHPMWRADQTLANLCKALAAIIEGPVTIPPPSSS